MVTLILLMSACGGSSGLSEAKLAYKDGLDASGQGLITEAISHFDKAIQLDPYDSLLLAMAYDGRGLAYRMLGRNAEADADEAKACSVDSQYC